MGHQLLGQHQGEDAAFARRAVHVDRSAQQLRQVARDRQAQARAAVFAVGAAIGLAEGFENQLLLVRRDADARVLTANDRCRPGYDDTCSATRPSR